MGAATKVMWYDFVPLVCELHVVCADRQETLCSIAERRWLHGAKLLAMTGGTALFQKTLPLLRRATRTRDRDKAGEDITLFCGCSNCLYLGFEHPEQAQDRLVAMRSWYAYTLFCTFRDGNA
jgi:hypothetical protein